MKKMMTALLVFGAVFAVNAHAASKSDIWDLLQRIDSELRYYDQSPSDLDRVQAKLQEALAELRGQPGENPQACLDYTYTEFKKDGYSNSIAMEKGKDLCNRMSANGVTMPVLAFFYENLRKDGYNVPTAFDQSLEMAKNVNEGQLSCLRTAFERYSDDGYSARQALQKSADFCSR